MEKGQWLEGGGQTLEVRSQRSEVRGHFLLALDEAGTLARFAGREPCRRNR